jgi:hypothetical protein
VGERVVVQMWNGRLTMVWAGPSAMRTDQNPDYQYTTNTQGLLLFPFMTVVFALVTVGVAFARPLRLRVLWHNEVSLGHRTPSSSASSCRR